MGLTPVQPKTPTTHQSGVSQEPLPLSLPAQGMCQVSYYIVFLDSGITENGHVLSLQECCHC